MKIELNKNQIKYIISQLGIEDSLKYNKWELTDDKSYDDIKTEYNYLAFPYVLLINDKFFDAITETFKNEIFMIK